VEPRIVPDTCFFATDAFYVYSFKTAPYKIFFIVDAQTTCARRHTPEAKKIPPIPLFT
jgi:hypothetical protein